MIPCQIEFSIKGCKNKGGTFIGSKFKSSSTFTVYSKPPLTRICSNLTYNDRMPNSSANVDVGLDELFKIIRINRENLVI